MLIDVLHECLLQSKNIEIQERAIILLRYYLPNNIVTIYHITTAKTHLFIHGQTSPYYDPRLQTKDLGLIVIKAPPFELIHIKNFRLTLKTTQISMDPLNDQLNA